MSENTGRTFRVTRASQIQPRPVHWLWDGRLAVGTLNLMAGREGIGKSIAMCNIVADITRGRLPGKYLGKPRAVIIAATEDSWEHTLVPRLMGADADLTLVYRVDVETAAGADSALSLPADITDVEALIRETRAVLLVLDPLMSRLDVKLDTHKDSEVRQALEPMTAVANRTGCCISGLIHVNKSTSNDPLTQLMASRAFAAVPRAVLFVMVDPNDDKRRLLGLAKNNLGRMDLPALAFHIEGVKVADTDEGPVWTGKLHWLGESDTSIHDAMQVAAETVGGNKTATTEAAAWLEDYLTSVGGSADSSDIKAEGNKAGHSKDALHRARLKLQITTNSVGFPRRTHWQLPVVAVSGESATTTTTTTTATTGRQSLQSSRSLQSLETPQKRATTGFAFDYDPFGDRRPS